MERVILACERPAPVLERFTIAIIILMTALRAYAAATVGLSSDEAYYWQWTQSLQLSYFDHPAMVAYWIWSAIHLVGENDFGVRLPALLGSLITTALIWDTTRLSFQSRAAAAWAALWLNVCTLFVVGGIIVTPDTPLLVFWSLALWGMTRLIRLGRPRWLYVVALGLGLGAISKYTILLLVPGLIATTLLFPNLRRWWKRPVTISAVILAALCTTPLWVWNINNNFASFQKQLNHAAADPGQIKMLSNLGTFIGSQIGLVTPLMFGFCLWGMIWVLWRGWRNKRAEWMMLGLTSLPILLYFLQHSLGSLVQAHWGGPAYLSAVCATCGAMQNIRRPAIRRLFVAAPVLASVISLGLLYHASTVGLPIPLKIDPLKRLGGWDELAEQVQEELHDHPAAFLFTENHEPTGPLSYLLPGHPPVFLEGPIRPSYYTEADVAALKGRDCILVTRTGSGEAEYAQRFFKTFRLLRSVPLHWGGRSFVTYDLFLGEGYSGGLLTMGDGLHGIQDKPTETPEQPAQPQ